ncbi:MAG: hypothetical protein FWB78_06080 [Treponema sp.]|nr:hypothetical protein [Treponema sp.]
MPHRVVAVFHFADLPWLHVFDMLAVFLPPERESITSFQNGTLAFVVDMM